MKNADERSKKPPVVAVGGVQFERLSGTPPKVAGTYVVFHGTTCLYVGTAENLYRRIRSHKSDPWYRLVAKDFDWYISTEVEEGDAILALNPLLNVTSGTVVMQLTDAEKAHRYQQWYRNWYEKVGRPRYYAKKGKPCPPSKTSGGR